MMANQVRNALNATTRTLNITMKDVNGIITTTKDKTMARKPILGTAMTGAERQRRHREKIRKQTPDPQYKGWKEATLAWMVCASIHREYAKGKDPFFTTRQQDFLRHERNARDKFLSMIKGKPEEAA